MPTVSRTTPSSSPDSSTKIEIPTKSSESGLSKVPDTLAGNTPKQEETSWFSLPRRAYNYIASLCSSVWNYLCSLVGWGSTAEESTKDSKESSTSAASKTSSSVAKTGNRELTGQEALTKVAYFLDAKIEPRLFENVSQKEVKVFCLFEWNGTGLFHNAIITKDTLISSRQEFFDWIEGLKPMFRLEIPKPLTVKLAYLRTECNGTMVKNLHLIQERHTKDSEEFSPYSIYFEDQREKFVRDFFSPEALDIIVEGCLLFFDGPDQVHSTPEKKEKPKPTPAINSTTVETATRTTFSLDEAKAAAIEFLDKRIKSDVLFDNVSQKEIKVSCLFEWNGNTLFHSDVILKSTILESKIKFLKWIRDATPQFNQGGMGSAAVKLLFLRKECNGKTVKNIHMIQERWPKGTVAFSPHTIYTHDQRDAWLNDFLPESASLTTKAGWHGFFEGIDGPDPAQLAAITQVREPVKDAQLYVKVAAQGKEWISSFVKEMENFLPSGNITTLVTWGERHIIGQCKATIDPKDKQKSFSSFIENSCKMLTTALGEISVNLTKEVAPQLGVQVMIMPTRDDEMRIAVMRTEKTFGPGEKLLYSENAAFPRSDINTYIQTYFRTSTVTATANLLEFLKRKDPFEATTTHIYKGNDALTDYTQTI